MSERRFVIAEMLTDEEGSIDSITESELKRRLLTIMALAKFGLAESYDYVIALLLKGEGEFARGFKKGRDSVLRQNPSGCCCKFDEAGDTVLEVCAAHRDWATKQPSPTPTREEWEAWINRMPVAEVDKIVTIGTDCDEDLAAWLLSMPCVPKE